MQVVESPNNDGGLPFKEPVDSAELNLAADPIESDEAQSGALAESSSVVPDAQTSGESDPQVDELSASRLLEQLSLGFDSLKELNLEGFKQIYPIFLIVFGAVVVGLILSFIAHFLDSINHMPLVGGLFQGLSELVGLVALVRLVTSNLLLQHKRAELYARIADLKKDLIGGTD